MVWVKIVTISQARKILGSTAEHMTDDQVLRHIDEATLLKNIFFTPEIYSFVSNGAVDSISKRSNND